MLHCPANGEMYVKHVTSLALASVFVFTNSDTMSAVTKTLEMASENAALPENVKALLLTAHNTSTAKEKINFYNTWAQNYDQVCGNKLTKKIPCQGKFCSFWIWNENSCIFCCGLIGCGRPGVPCVSPRSKQYFNTLPWRSRCSSRVGRRLWYRNGGQRGIFTR